MTQKRILRANTRKVARERDLLIRDAFLMYAKDPDDPEVEELVNRLATEEPGETALAFFEVANRLLAELSETTGSAPKDVLARTLRG